MTSLKISDLIIHPKNDFYFDDVSGDKWERLLESIKANGVRTPIIVTDDMRVVSGNQRVRACKELGISVINAEIVHYQNEDDIIRDLIEINIRQRGVIDDSEIKAGRRLKFLEDYYGIKNGVRSDRKKLPQIAEGKTQPQLASELGMSVDKMQRLVKLAEMIPEMQELVETGKVTPTTARAIVKQLSEDEQRTMAKEISGTDISVKEWQAKYEAEKQKRKEAESRQPEIREVTKEVVRKVVPEDYELLKARVNSQSKEEKRLADEYHRIQAENAEQKARIKQLEERDGIREERDRLEREAEYFDMHVTNFIRTVGGYVWITERLDSLSEDKRKRVVQNIKNINAWTQQMILNIGGELIGK